MQLEALSLLPCSCLLKSLGFTRLEYNLSGGTNPWQLEPGEQPEKKTFKKALTDGYAHLGTDQMKNLMGEYQANYFVTRLGQQLDLPIAYQNAEHILYTSPEAS